MKRFTLETAPRYGRHYSDKGFWHKLHRLAIKAGKGILVPALQLYYLLQSHEVPTRTKTLLLGALGYLILPIDLVPDFIPALGFTDDLTALLMVVREVKKHLTPDIKKQAQSQADKLLKS